MRIAVASNGLEIADSQVSWGNLNCYSSVSYEIVESQNVPITTTTTADLVRLIRLIGPDALICSSIPLSVARELQDADIKIITGKSGSALNAANDFLSTYATNYEFDDEEEA